MTLANQIRKITNPRTEKAFLTGAGDRREISPHIRRWRRHRPDTTTTNTQKWVDVLRRRKGKAQLVVESGPERSKLARPFLATSLAERKSAMAILHRTVLLLTVTRDEQTTCRPPGLRSSHSG